MSSKWWLLSGLVMLVASLYFFASNKYQYLDEQIGEVVKKFGKNKSTRSRKILVPLPERDFDPTEVAVAWKIFTMHGFKVVFASEKGQGTQFEADPITLHGTNLTMVTRALFALLSLRATDEVVSLYHEMSQTTEFLHPLSFSQIQVQDYDAVWLSGGHAPRMKRDYLESSTLHVKMAQFWQTKKPVAAVCHGVLVLARTLLDGKSVLYGRKTTSLTNKQESIAYWLTRSFFGNLYKTYPESTEDEVKRAVYGAKTIEHANAEHAKLQLFDEGPFAASKANLDNIAVAGSFFVQDEFYFSGRWPGDVHLLAARFVQYMEQV